MQINLCIYSSVRKFWIKLFKSVYFKTLSNLKDKNVEIIDVRKYSKIAILYSFLLKNGILLKDTIKLLN